MISFQHFMEIYALVFHPLPLLFAMSSLMIYYEWRRDDKPWLILWDRWLAFIGITMLALIPVLTYAILYTDGLGLFLSNDWVTDMLTGTSLLISSTLTFVTWRKNNWGELMPRAAAAITFVMIGHVAISPFWNISGHVAFSLLPTLYITLVDRRFWPTLIIPVTLIANRPIVNAHTWAQSISGFILALVLTPIAYYYFDRFDQLVLKNSSQELS